MKKQHALRVLADETAGIYGDLHQNGWPGPGFTEDDQRSFRYHNSSYAQATFTGDLRWFGSLFLLAIFMLETFKSSRRS